MYFDELVSAKCAMPMSYDQLETEAHILGMSVNEYRSYMADRDQKATIDYCLKRRANVGKNIHPEKAVEEKPKEVPIEERAAFEERVREAERRSLEISRILRKKERIRKMVEIRKTQTKIVVPEDDRDYIEYQMNRVWPMLVTFTEREEHLVEIFRHTDQIFIDPDNAVVLTSTRDVNKWTIVTAVLQLSAHLLNTVIMCPIKTGAYWDVAEAYIKTPAANSLRKSCRVILEHPKNNDGTLKRIQDMDKQYFMDIGQLDRNAFWENEANRWNQQKLGKYIIVQFAYPDHELIGVYPTLPEIAEWLGEDFWNDILNFYVKDATKFPGNTRQTKHVYGVIGYDLPSLLRYTETGDLYHIMYRSISHLQWYKPANVTAEYVEEAFHHHIEDDSKLEADELYSKFGFKVF